MAFAAHGASKPCRLVADCLDQCLSRREFHRLGLEAGAVVFWTKKTWIPTRYTNTERSGSLRLLSVRVQFTQWTRGLVPIADRESSDAFRFLKWTWRALFSRQELVVFILLVFVATFLGLWTDTFFPSNESLQCAARLLLDRYRRFWREHGDYHRGIDLSPAR